MFNVSELITAKVNALLSEEKLESMIADAIGKELEKMYAKVDDIISDAVADMTSGIEDALETAVRDRVESIADYYDYGDVIEDWVENNVGESDVEYEIDQRVECILDNCYVDDYISDAVEALVDIGDGYINDAVEYYIREEYNVEAMVGEAVEKRIAEMCGNADATPKADTPAVDAEAPMTEAEAVLDADSIINTTEHYSITVYTKADDEYLFPTYAMAMAFYDEKIDAGIPVGLVEYYTTPNAIWMYADKPTNSAEYRKLNDLE